METKADYFTRVEKVVLENEILTADVNSLDAECAVLKLQAFERGRALAEVRKMLKAGCPREEIIAVIDGVA